MKKEAEGANLTDLIKAFRNLTNRYFSVKIRVIRIQKIIRIFKIKNTEK